MKVHAPQILGPFFALPLTATLYDQQPYDGKTAEKDTDYDSGLIFMATASGRHSEPHITPSSTTALIQSLESTRLEGRAPALFHLILLKNDTTDILSQWSWCHRDLQYIIISEDHARVNYLDFEKMAGCKNWFEEARCVAGAHKTTPAQILDLTKTKFLAPTGCLDNLEGWLGDSM